MSLCGDAALCQRRLGAERVTPNFCAIRLRLSQRLPPVAHTRLLVPTQCRGRSKRPTPVWLGCQPTERPSGRACTAAGQPAHDPRQTRGAVSSAQAGRHRFGPSKPGGSQKAVDHPDAEPLHQRVATDGCQCAVWFLGGMCRVTIAASTLESCTEHVAICATERSNYPAFRHSGMIVIDPKLTNRYHGGECQASESQTVCKR